MSQQASILCGTLEITVPDPRLHPSLAMAQEVSGLTAIMCHWAGLQLPDMMVTQREWRFRCPLLPPTLTSRPRENIFIW